jgi:hypothetical protein
VPCEAFSPKLPLDYILSGDSGVIRPRHPQHLEAFEPFIPAKYVLESVIESMPHVELAGYVRRRDDYGVGRFKTGLVGAEKMFFFPIPVPMRFDFGKFISFRQSALAHRIDSPAKVLS